MRRTEVPLASSPSTTRTRAATPTPTRMAAAEDVLAGGSYDEDTLRRAGDAAADEADLISDPQGSAAYKRELLRVTVGRAVRQALNGEAG